MSRLSKEQRSRPLKEENIKASDIFLNEVSKYYEEYRDKFKLNCLKEHTVFDDDIYSDTLLKCYDSIQRNGLADTSTQGCLNYFFQSFKINIKREADYSRNRMRGEMPVKDTREFESSNKKVNEQLFDDFTVIYILEVVENNFDPLDFYLYRLKFLIPKMTYDKLRRITHIKDCKKRIIRINHFLKDNITMKDIYTAFSTKYPDFTNEYV